MEELIVLDDLNINSVSVVKRKYIQHEGEKFIVGNPHRCAYVNSIKGRIQINRDLCEPYLSAVFSIWGSLPTVVEESVD